MGNFFRKNGGSQSGGKKSSGGRSFGKKKKAPSGKYVSLGVAWLLDIGGELPGISISMSPLDLDNLAKLADNSADGGVKFMMFPNRNQRNEKDPDYNLVPHKDDRELFDGDDDDEGDLQGHDDVQY